jgi:predicted metal-binding membrane protein
VTSPAAHVLRRDRIVVLGALAGTAGLSWLYVLQMSSAHVALAVRGKALPLPVLSCCGVDFWTAFLMWTVMMVGMMVPSAAPMVLAFAAINRKRAERGGPYVPTTVFLGGYLLAWTAFSAVAAGAQWALYHASLLNPHSQTVGPWLAGLLLLSAGAFQLSPAKDACLASCRSPLGFLMTEWRDGSRGALRMGLRHGMACIGCCWLLMALLFVAGVMNLLWVAFIAAYVFVEKVLPWGRSVARLGAAGCAVAGVALIVRAVWPS